MAVEGVAESGEVTTVYNLRVAEYHTYYVGSQTWGFSVWVHNSCTEEESRAIAAMKRKGASKLADGSAGYNDDLGFPIRHSRHEGDGHLLRMRDVANQRIKSVNGSADDTIVLYNKPLRKAENPFAIENDRIKPDVQVFQKVGENWKRVGLPVEVELEGSDVGRQRNIDKYGTDVGGAFDLETYE